MPANTRWKGSKLISQAKHKPVMSLKKGMRGSKSKDEFAVGGKGIRTRLSTGTIHVSGTQTFKDVRCMDSPEGMKTPTQKGQGDAFSSSSGQKHRIRETPGAATESWQGPPPKKRKIGKNDGSGEDNKNDYFCWVCHKDGLMVCCEICPRVYHAKCLNVEDDLPSDWVCPECERIMRAECIDTQSKAMKMITLDLLCFLLKFTLERMKSCPDSEVFMNDVDPKEVPNYTDYVFHPMTLSQMEKNIKRKLYGSTDAFLADAKWILHNSYVFNGMHHKLTSTAKTMLKICKHEVSEIEVCPDCYLNSCKREEHWFCQPCRTPHTLVWAKLKGYPFWPAKVLREEGGQLDVRFFGAHDRSWVSKSQVFLLSEQPPTTMQKRSSGMDSAMEETRIHVENIRNKFGSFEYAKHRTPYDSGHIYTPMRMRVKKKMKSPKKKFHLLQKNLLSASDSKPVDKASVVSKTASALKSKYSSIITTRRASGSKVKSLPAGVFKVSRKDGSDSDLNMFNASNDQELTVPKLRLPDKDVIRKLEEKIGQMNEESEEEGCSKPVVRVTVSDETVTVSTKTNSLCSMETDEEGREDVKREHDENGKEDVSVESAGKIIKDRVLDTTDSESSTPSKSEYLSSLKKTIHSCIEQLGISEDKLQASPVCSQSEEEEEEEDDDDDDDEEEATDDEESVKEEEEESQKDKLELKVKLIKKQKLPDDSTAPTDKMLCASSKEENENSDPIEEASKVLEKYNDVTSIDNAGSSECGDTDLEKITANRTLSEKGLETKKLTRKDSEDEITFKRKMPDQDDEAASSKDRLKSDSENSDNIKVTRENFKHVLDKTFSKTKSEKLPESTKSSNISETTNIIRVSDEATKTDKDSEQTTKTIEVSEEAPKSDKISEQAEKTVNVSEEAKESENDSEETPKIVKSSSNGKKATHTKYNVMKLDSDFEPTLVMEIDSGDDSDSQLIIDIDDESKNNSKMSDYQKSDVIATTDKILSPSPKDVFSSQKVVRCFPKTSQSTPSSAGRKTVLSTMLKEVGKLTSITSPSSSSSSSSSKPSSSDTVPTSVIETYTNKLVSSLKRPLEEFVSDIWQHAQSEVKGHASSDEINELRYIHSQEIMELKHNFKLTVAEMKAAWEAEKNKLFRELKRIFDQEKEACVAAAKKKQWCANCSKEAIYYCCWNTSYCDYACQQAHWPEHLPNCMQAIQENEKSKSETATSTASSSTDSSVIVKTSSSQNQNSWAEKEEAMQAQKTFNLTPPASVPTLQNSSQSEAWRNARQQQQQQQQQQVQTNIHFLSQPSFQVLPPQVTQPLRLQSQVLSGQTGIPNIVPHGQVIPNTNSLMYPMIRQPHQMNSANLMPRTSVFLTQNGPPHRGQSVVPNQLQFQMRPSY